MMFYYNTGGNMTAHNYPKTLDELLLIEDAPVVGIDQESIFFFINPCFEKKYGWKKNDLLHKPVTEIMPAHMRSAHNVGFSRFLTTETSVLLGKPLPLSVLYKDGREEIAAHYILAEKNDGRWRFGAIIGEREQE
jgi:hypothetical protein